MNRLLALSLVSCFVFVACGSDEPAGPSLTVEIHGPDDGPDTDTIGFPIAVDECVGTLRFSSMLGSRIVAVTEFPRSSTTAVLPRIPYGSDVWIAVEGVSDNFCVDRVDSVASDTVVASGATARFTFEEGGALPDLTIAFTGIPERFQTAFRIERDETEGTSTSRDLVYELRQNERAGHTMTALEDGSGWVVIGGAKMSGADGIASSGITGVLDAIEFYDSYNGQFLTVWDSEEPCTSGDNVECALRLPEGVAFHTATSMLDGRILILGGLRVSGGDALLPTSSAYVFEMMGYAEGRLTPVNYDSDAFPTDRAFHTATRMGDGRVVIVGGIGRTFGPDPTFQGDIHQVLPGTELIIADSGADLTHVRGLHTANAFDRNDHGLIVVGGRNVSGVVATSEVIYAVANDENQRLGVDVFGSDNSVNDLAVPRFGHSAVGYMCPGSDEEFLAVVGGFTEVSGTFIDGGAPTAQVEFYRPDDFAETTKYAWSDDRVALANGGRAFGAAVSLPISGDLIFAGGIDADGAPSRAADRVIADWGQCARMVSPQAIEGGMGTARAFLALAPLSSGFLLANGGFDGSGSTESSEFFNPNELTLAREYLQ